MNTQAHRLDALEKRLHNFEGRCSALASQNAVLSNQNRRLKMPGVLALVLIAAVVLVGAAAPKPKTIEAEKFVVIDADGEKRAELGMFRPDADGAPVPKLRLYDDKGNARAGMGLADDGAWYVGVGSEAEDAQAWLEIQHDGSAYLALSDQGGKVRASLGVSDGDGFVGLLDKDEKPSVWMATAEDGPSLAFFNAVGVVRAAIALAEDEPYMSAYDENQEAGIMVGVFEGKPSLLLFDENERRRAFLTVSDDGSGLALYDENEEEHLSLVAKEDKSGFGLWDKNGKARAGLFLREDDSPLLMLYDENQDVVWQAPPPDDAPEEPETGEE